MATARKRPTRTAKPTTTRCGVALSPTELRGEHQRGVVLRLRRAEGQIRGVLRMIEAGESCDDIAQQLAAARTALDRAFFEMMACSLETEIVESTGSNKRHERVSEILRVLSKYA